MSHDHQGREHTSRGARRHRACYQSGESSPLGFGRQVDELGQSNGVGGGGRSRDGGGGGVKGEVGGGGRARSVGGEREGARGVVPSHGFKNGAARPTCPGLFQQESGGSGSGEQQPCLLLLLLPPPLLLPLSVSQYSLAEVTPSLPPSLSVSSTPPSPSFLGCTLLQQSLSFCPAHSHSPMSVVVALFQ